MAALAPWSTACLDWETRIVKRMSLLPLKPLFPEQAAKGLDYFNSFVMVDAGDGTQTMGELSQPWIKDFVAQVFGAYEKSTGRQHITEFFMLIPKKNGKSTDAAAIMLTALLLNWRKSAELIILSPTVEIAGNSFKPVQDMVNACEELKDLLHVQPHIRTITHRVTGATLKVIAADSEAVGGKKASVILIDELWLFGKRANAENMLREATGGLASRHEGFVIYLTTQSDEPPAGIFKMKLDYARKVRDGEIHDPQFLPIIYEFPISMIENEEHLDPKNFGIVNPNLGYSVDIPFIEREYRKAQETGEETMRGFLAKSLNVEIGLNLRSDRWPGAEFWEGQADAEPVTIKRIIAECEVVTVGIDGGGLDDLLGLAIVGRRKKFEPITIEAYKDEHGIWQPAETVMRQRWLVFTYAWAHPSVLNRRKDIAPRLKDFSAARELTLVNAVGQDVDQLAQMVKQVEDAGLLFEVGLDPNCIGGVLDGILQVGVNEDKMKSVNQGYRLAGAIKTTERKLAEHVLVHGGTRLMNWCVGNARVKAVGNAIVITKQISGTSKIDPLMAVFNGVSLMALNPPAQSAELDFSKMVVAG